MTECERAYEDKLAEESQEILKTMEDEVEKIEQRVAVEVESRRGEIISILSRLEALQVIKKTASLKYRVTCYVFNVPCILQHVIDSQGEADNESSNVHAIAAATLVCFIIPIDRWWFRVNRALREIKSH